LYYFPRDDPKDVEPITPPAGSEPGDRVMVEGYEDGKPEEVLNPKKKIWEKLSVDLKINANNTAQWQGNDLITSKGTVTSKRLNNVPIR